MKSRTSIKTRLLALVLTVLMTVGVLPFSVFALDGVATEDRLETDNALFVAPTGEQIIEILGEDALIYYNTFNDGSADGSAIGDASFTRNRGWKFVDDGNGGKAVQTKAGEQQNTKITIGKNDGAQVATLSGKSFVVSGDYKLGASTTAGALFYFTTQVNGASANVNYTAMPVWIDAAGNLYNGQLTTTTGSYTGGTLWRQNDVTNSALFTTADKKIGTLTADKFTNIAVAVDVENNKYSIYVDGVCMAKDQLFACQNVLDDFNKVDAEDGTTNFANGFGLKDVNLGYRNQVTGDSYIFDNWLVYLSDKYVTLYGSEYDSALTADDFSGNNPTLLHYNDFNNQTITPDGEKAPSTYSSTLSIGANLSASLRSGAGEAIVDDGRGGKALTYKKSANIPDGFQPHYQIDAISGGGEATVNSGKSFVVSSDFKLTAATSAQLLEACAVNANTDTYGTDFNVQFVYTMEDGGIYIARKSDETSTGVYVNDDSAWKNNLVKIGYLSTSFFTNIAVAVNVEANTMRVYINGVDATGELQFLTDSDKDIIEGSAKYPNGFGYSYTRIRFGNADYKNNDAPVIIDNVATYFADDIVKPNKNPLNGYIKDGGKYYYYNKGNIATNFVSADGILNAKLDGVVKYGVEPVASISSIYKYVGTDVIPVDGIFSGVYSYVKSANYYCYDASRNLIRNKTAYDAITEGITTDATKAVGFSIDGNGVATPLNGYIEVADGESYFYVNGIRTKGMVEIGGNIFFIADDYTFFAGYRVIGDKAYFFDASEDGKGALINGVHAVDMINSKYYVSGVAQTGLISADNTKYFADANGNLLTGIQEDPSSGDKYFFYADGADKYKLAVGVRIIWKKNNNNQIIITDENGIVDEIGGRVYGEWAEVDGKWYYSDASGNIATGLAYIEKDPTGDEGGYYYFDAKGNMVKETFVEIYGTTMYFHTDGKAPNGVVFVKYSAVNFPTVDLGRTTGEYMHFVDGVLATGKTEVIQDGMKFTFYNGRISAPAEELDENNPEILITIIKNGKKDSFFFNSEDNGEFNMLLTQYPCFTITVYDVTDKKNPVQIVANAVIEGEPSGRYTLVGAHTYEIVYEAVEHVFGTTPVDTVVATCGKDGYHVYTCTVDGCVATKREVIEATGNHVFLQTEYQVIEHPTCVQKGLGVSWCSVCGIEAQRIDIDIDPNAHKFTEWDVKYLATCQKDGIQYRECEYCGYYETEILKATGAHVKGALNTAESVKATCVSGGKNVYNCTNPDCDYKFVDYVSIDYENHAHGNEKGTLKNDDEPEVEYFELFQVVRPSTCYKKGLATYRCKDCGGFVYDVELKLDPDNHHYDADEEYLAVLDSEGNVIEVVRGASRLEMLANSKMICGYKAEWRIDCKNECKYEEDDATIYYTVVEEVEHNYLHSFDLEMLYTTSDKLDPLYGYHFYKCRNCGRAAGVEAHEMTYTDNGDGTHNYHCSENCVDEETELLYGDLNVECDPKNKYDEKHHWKECICGAKSDEIEHTLTDDYDNDYHWSECSCGYINKVEHGWTDVAAKASTCCETGYTAHKRCDCGAKSGYEVVGMTAHNISGVFDKNADGHWYICDLNCGANGEPCEFKYRYQAHNYVVVPELAPTCEGAGHSEYELCTDCGYRDGYSVIDATDHNVTGQPYNYDDANHWQICTACSERVTAAHTLGDRLSDEEGTMECDECKHIVVDLSLTWWKQLGLERVTVEGHYYYTYNGTVNALVVIDGNYYYFDNNGYLVLNGDSGVNNANVKAPNGTFDSITEMNGNRGIIRDAIIATANGTFYIKNGVIQTNWQTIEDKDYFFNTKLGEELVADAAEGALIKPADGETTIIALNKPENAKILVNVDANGARLLGVVDNGDGTASYYLDGTAGKLTGRIEDNYYNIGKLYFANADGVLYKGTWTSVNGVYYSFDDDDYFMTEWHINAATSLNIEGVKTTIYTDGEGRRIIDGWYLAHGVGGRYIENGVMVVASSEFNYMIIEDTYYAFDAYGVVSYYTGWNDGNTLYIASGIIVKNRFESIEGNNYYFDGEGQIVKAASGETIKVVIGSWVYSIDDTGAANQYIVGGENTAVWVYFIVDGKVDEKPMGYYTSTGLIKDQAFVIDTATYIFDENGRLVTSKDNYECNGVVYIIDAEGKATAKDEDDD